MKIVLEMGIPILVGENGVGMMMTFPGRGIVGLIMAGLTFPLAGDLGVVIGVIHVLPAIFAFAFGVKVRSRSTAFCCVDLLSRYLPVCRDFNRLISLPTTLTTILFLVVGPGGHSQLL